MSIAALATHVIRQGAVNQTGSGQQMTLWEVSQELARRLAQIFLRDGEGKRTVYGGMEKFQADPNWRDHLLFHEYVHGDNGAGLGARARKQDFPVFSCSVRCLILPNRAG